MEWERLSHQDHVSNGKSIEVHAGGVEHDVRIIGVPNRNVNVRPMGRGRGGQVWKDDQGPRMRGRLHVGRDARNQRGRIGEGEQQRRRGSLVAPSIHLNGL